MSSMLPSAALRRGPSFASWQRPGLGGALAVWGGFAAVLLLAPLLWGSSLAHTLLSQMGIAIVACLAYNILLGQGGMLSFGHAVYSGMGAFCAIHTLNMVGAGALAMPVSVVPLVGGVAGLLFAAAFGYVSTRKSGTTFAMITLGVGELVWSMSLMVPEFFGGEGGISGNRVAGRPFLGITFGPQIEVYYLIAAYCFVCTALMYALTRTPLGRMLNAVRDNPERVEFIGYSTRHVRYLAFMVAGFFAGVAGGLSAINFEIVTAEVVSTARSGAYLLFVFVGGTGLFYGPIIGAVLMVVALVLLSEITKAWLFHLGLLFLFMVVYVPGGVASLVQAGRQVLARGGLPHLWRAGLALAASAVPLLLGAFALVEMVYHRNTDAGMGSATRFFGVMLDTGSPLDWAAVLATMAAGMVALFLARRHAAERWDAFQRVVMTGQGGEAQEVAP